MSALTRREQTSIEYTTGLLVTRFQNDNQQATIDRLTRLMDEAGIPDNDFESRVAYAIGYYQSVQEMRKPCLSQQ